MNANALILCSGFGSRKLYSGVCRPWHSEHSGELKMALACLEDKFSNVFHHLYVGNLGEWWQRELVGDCSTFAHHSKFKDLLWPVGLATKPTQTKRYVTGVAGLSEGENLQDIWTNCRGSFASSQLSSLLMCRNGAGSDFSQHQCMVSGDTSTGDSPYTLI